MMQTLQKTGGINVSEVTIIDGIYEAHLMSRDCDCR
jgi:hypothetical protein